MKHNILILFAFILLFSYHCSAQFYFNHQDPVTEKIDSGNYLIKNDGTKIFGKKIGWEVGAFAKSTIHIDEQIFPKSEVNAYVQNGIYYIHFAKQYIGRVSKGKVNIYLNFRDYKTDIYAQKGENGELKQIKKKDDLKELLSDCAKAVEMIDISNSEMNAAIRDDRSYLNKVMLFYNNGCKK